MPDFSADERNYYKDPHADYATATDPLAADCVTSIVYRISINQPQWADTAKTRARQTDFGTWFQYNSLNNDSFEVTGRFYKVKSNVYSTTEVRVRLGGETGNGADRAGHKAVVRYDDGLRNAGNAYRSVLSFQDYVPTGSHSHMVNKMRHLRTSARATVVETGAYTRKGHLGSWENGRDGIAGFDGATEIKFSSDQYYSVSLQRRYGSWGTRGYADYNNWGGKVSFSDEIVLRDDMPVCRPDAELEYYGFLSTGIRLVNRTSDDVLSRMSYIKFRLRAYAADGSISERYAVIKRDDLNIATGKDAYVYFKRPNEEPATQIANAQSAGLPMATLNLSANEFVVSYDIVMRNFGGEGDVTQEVARHHAAEYNRNFGDIDVQVYGRPYTFQNQTSTVLNDSTNYSRVFTRRYPTFGNGNALTGDPGGYWFGTLNPRDAYQNQYVDTDSAYLMGYLIPFGYHFSLQRTRDDSSTGNMSYFSSADDLTPASGSFEARFQNYADGTWNNQENRLRASHISHVTLAATTNANFRMQKVYLPSELLPDTPEWPKKAQVDADGNPVLNTSTRKPVLTAGDNTEWLRVKSFSFAYGSTQVKLAYDAGRKSWLIQNGLHPGTYLTWQELKDRGIVSAEKLDSGTYAGCYAIDIEAYLREQFKLYASTGGAEGIRPITYTAVSATNLMGGYAPDIATANRTYVNTRVSSLVVEYDSPAANRRRPETMLDSNQFLAGDPTGVRGNAYNYAFAYDGVYADRTLDDFVSAEATTATDLAAGNWNEYATPTGNKTGMAYLSYTWNESLAVSAVQSKDPNRAPLNSSAYVSGLRHDPVAGNTLRHRLAQMETSMVRGKAVTVNGRAGTIFAYDNSDSDIGAPVSYSTESTAKDWGIPDGALYPGDYVEYTLRVGNKSAAAGSDTYVALEHVDAMFRVQKGQRIVGWEVSKKKNADGTWVADNTAGHEVTALVGNLNRTDMREAPQQTDLSLVGTGSAAREAYDENRVLIFRVGDNKWDDDAQITPRENRRFDPGDYVTIRVITQMTGELESESYLSSENAPMNGAGDTLPHRGSTVLADWFAVSAPIHGYLPYTVPGGGDADHNVWAYSNDMGGRWVNGYTTAHERTLYDLYPMTAPDRFVQARSQFGSRVYSYTRFYNHLGDYTRANDNHYDDPKLSFNFTGLDPATMLTGRPRSDGDTAQLTVHNLNNPTYHTSDITVTVRLTDASGRQGFELTDTPKLATGSAGNFDMVRDTAGKRVNLRYPADIPPSTQQLTDHGAKLSDVLTSVSQGGGSVGGGGGLVDGTDDTEKQRYTVTYAIDGGGYFTVDGERVRELTNAEMDATATDKVTGASAQVLPGWVFDGWYVTGVGDDGAETERKLENLPAALSDQDAVANLNTRAADDGGTDTIYADTTFVARFVPSATQVYGITYEADENGSVSHESDGGIQVLGTEGVSGSEAAPDEGFVLDGWYVRTVDDEGNETDVLVDDEHLTLTPDVAAAHVQKNSDGLYVNTTFVAKFKDKSKRTFRITYLAGDNGEVRTFQLKDGSVTVLDGPAATLTTPRMLCAGDDELIGGEAIPETGYRFAGWFSREEGPLGRPIDTLVGSASQLGVDDLANVLPVDEDNYYLDATFVAKFTAETDEVYAVSYTATEGGSVSIAKNTGLMALTVKGVTGSVATARPGYVFDGWYVRETVDGAVTERKIDGAAAELTAGVAAANLGHRTVEVTEGDGDGDASAPAAQTLFADTVFVARFVPAASDTYTITYAADEHGAVDVTTNVLQVLSHAGATGSLATPDAGYAFVGWFKRERVVTQVPALDEDGLPLRGEDGSIVTKEEITYKDTPVPEAAAQLAPDKLAALLSVGEDGLYRDTMFVAKFAPDANATYTITYLAENGTVSADEDADIQALGIDGVGGTTASTTLSATDAEVPVFAGWFTRTYTIEQNPVWDTVQEPLFQDVDEPVLDEDGYPTFDEEGNPITQTVTRPVTDEEGNQVYQEVTKKDAEGNPVQKVDEAGNPLFTEERVPHDAPVVFTKDEKAADGFDAEVLTPELIAPRLARTGEGLYADTIFVAKYAMGEPGAGSEDPEVPDGPDTPEPPTPPTPEKPTITNATVHESVDTETAADRGERPKIFIEYYDKLAGRWITIEELDALVKVAESDENDPRHVTISEEGYFANSNKFRFVTAVRWTYYDVPATRDNAAANGYGASNPYTLDDVALVGVARYQQTRDNAGELSEYWTATGHTVDVGYTHRHTELTQLDFTREGAAGDASVALTDARRHFSDNGASTLKTKADSSTSAAFNVYRRTPVVRFQNQVFQTESQAMGASPTNWSAAQKTGYIPGEKFWYKDTLWNTRRGTNAYMDVEGELYNPVFYERIPLDYLKTDDGSEIDAAYLADRFKTNLRWKNVFGEDVLDARTNGMKLKVTRVAEDDAPERARDVGGAMNYNMTPKGYTANRNGKPFNDMNPQTAAETTRFALFRIEWVVDPAYSGERAGSIVPDWRAEVSPVDLANHGTVCVEVGDTIELWFDVTAAVDGLPQVFENVGQSWSGTTGAEPAYFPRVGEYWHTYADTSGNNNYSGRIYVNPLSGGGYTASRPGVGAAAVNNGSALMDMDSLLHESGFTAARAKNSDRWEMLDGSLTFIPGEAANQNADERGWYTRPNTLYGADGFRGTYLDSDVRTANNVQWTRYTPVRPSGAAFAIANDLPSSVKLINGYATGRNSECDDSRFDRDYNKLVTYPRTAGALRRYLSADGEALRLPTKWGSDTPIIWSQTRVHLQKAWLATASEMIPVADSSAAGGSNPDGTAAYEASRQYLSGRDANEWWYEYRASNATLRDHRGVLWGQYDSALQYNQDYTARLQALNYGDRNLDAVEFTYIFPRGAEPKLDEAGVPIVNAQVLSQVSGVSGYGSTPAVNETYASIAADKVSVEVVQTPWGDYAGYDAPASSQNPADYRNGLALASRDLSLDPTLSSYEALAAPDDSQRGAGYVESSQPWVLRITVTCPLGKWFGRNIDSTAVNTADADGYSGNAGYKIRVNIASHIFSTNNSGYWYDRVLARPIDVREVTENKDTATGGLPSKASAYYQLFDLDHFEGRAAWEADTNKSDGDLNNCQPFGMDYVWSARYWNGSSSGNMDSRYDRAYGSPNMPSVGGRTVQNNTVTIEEEPAGKRMMNTSGVQWKSAYKTMGEEEQPVYYVQTGTRSRMRKPFVRTWATVGSDGVTADSSAYYLESENDRRQLNVHVENRYWWNRLAHNQQANQPGGNYYSYGGRWERLYHTYSVDGGQMGDMPLPVVTIVLPEGLVPARASGKPYSCKPDVPQVFETTDWSVNYAYNATKDTRGLLANGNDAKDAWKDFKATVTYEKVADQSTPANEQYRFVVRFEARGDVDLTGQSAVTYNASAPDDITTETAVNGARSREQRLVAYGTDTFKFNILTLGAPRQDATEKSHDEVIRSYENIRTYVSSKMDGYQFLADSDISGNPCQVGNLAQYRLRGSAGEDIRLDARQAVYRTHNTYGYETNYNATNYYGASDNGLYRCVYAGVVPPNMLDDGPYTRNGEPQANWLPGFTRRYSEGQNGLDSLTPAASNAGMIVEDYRFRKNYALSAVSTRALNGNTSVRYTEAFARQTRAADGGKVTTTTDARAEGGLMSGLKLRAAYPTVKTKYWVAAGTGSSGRAAPATGTGAYWDQSLYNNGRSRYNRFWWLERGNAINLGGSRYDNNRSFQYGDTLWYTASFSNMNNGMQSSGVIAHAKIVFALDLPREVTFYGGKTLMNSRAEVTDAAYEMFLGDQDGADSQFIVEWDHSRRGANGGGRVTETFTPKQLVDAGWTVRILNQPDYTSDDYTSAGGGKNYAKPDGDDPTDLAPDTPPVKELTHEGETVVIELAPPDDATDAEFMRYETLYDAYLKGVHPDGYLAIGDTITLKVRTRIDNLGDGTDALVGMGSTYRERLNELRCWNGGNSTVYTTLHDTDLSWLDNTAGHTGAGWTHTFKNDVLDVDGTTVLQAAGSRAVKPTRERGTGSTSADDAASGVYNFRPQIMERFIRWSGYNGLVRSASDAEASLNTTTGEEVPAVDRDRDGDLTDGYSYDRSGYFRILKPSASVRGDTFIQRNLVTDQDFGISLADDSHQGGDNRFVITQAINTGAAVNSFIVDWQVPYYGTADALSYDAPLSDAAQPVVRALPYVSAVRTGVWEVPGAQWRTAQVAVDKNGNIISGQSTRASSVADATAIQEAEKAQAAARAGETAWDDAAAVAEGQGISEALEEKERAETHLKAAQAAALLADQKTTLPLMAAHTMTVPAAEGATAAAEGDEPVLSGRTFQVNYIMKTVSGSTSSPGELTNTQDLNLPVETGAGVRGSAATPIRDYQFLGWYKQVVAEDGTTEEVAVNYDLDANGVGTLTA